MTHVTYNEGVSLRCMWELIVWHSDNKFRHLFNYAPHLGDIKFRLTEDHVLSIIDTRGLLEPLTWDGNVYKTTKPCISSRVYMIFLDDGIRICADESNYEADQPQNELLTILTIGHLPVGTYTLRELLKTKPFGIPMALKNLPIYGLMPFIENGCIELDDINDATSAVITALKYEGIVDPVYCAYIKETDAYHIAYDTDKRRVSCEVPATVFRNFLSVFYGLLVKPGIGDRP